MEGFNKEIIVSQLLDDLYETILDPGRWEDFLSHTIEAVSAKSGVLRIVDISKMELSYAVFNNLDPDLQKAYQNYYVKIDPHIEALKRVPTGQMYTGEQVIPREQLLKSEYFTDYLKPQDSYFVSGGSIQRDDHYMIYIGLQRGLAKGAFTEKDVEFLQLLVPHLRRAVQLGKLLGFQNRQLDMAETALDRLGIGLFLLDEYGALVFANHRGDSLLKEGNSVHLVQNHLAAVNSRDATQLRHMIERALAQQKYDISAPVGSMILNSNKDSLDNRLFAVVFPVKNRGKYFDAFYSGASVAVYIGKLGVQSRFTDSLLRDIFGLTTAETRLVNDLMQGQVLKEICRQRRISMNTAKSQLQAIFNKTGVHKQSELMRLLSGSPFFLAQ